MRDVPTADLRTFVGAYLDRRLVRDVDLFAAEQQPETGRKQSRSGIIRAALIDYLAKHRGDTDKTA